MEKENNFIKMVNYNLKVNMSMEKDGKEKNIILLEIYYITLIMELEEEKNIIIMVN